MLHFGERRFPRSEFSQDTKSGKGWPGGVHTAAEGTLMGSVPGGFSWRAGGHRVPSKGCTNSRVSDLVHDENFSKID